MVEGVSWYVVHGVIDCANIHKILNNRLLPILWLLSFESGYYCVRDEKYSVKSVKKRGFRAISGRKIRLFAKNSRYLQSIPKINRHIHLLKTEAY